MRIKITSVFITIILLYTSKGYSQNQNYGSISYNKAINVSGKQIMLSKKISKAYLLLAKGIDNSIVKKEPNSSKFIFEKQ